MYTYPYMEMINSTARAGDLLAQGRVVAFPTGTAYGLAVDALQGHALQRLRNLKERPGDKSFTVFMREELWNTYLMLRAAERAILQAFNNQPLTLLVRPQEPLAHLAQDGYVGVRVIDHPLMAELADYAAGPLTATSANRSGQAPCYSPEDIIKNFLDIINPTSLAYGDIAPAGETTYDLSLAGILDGGVLPPRPPTTIARLEDEQVKIVRAGSITAAAVTSALSQS